MDRTNPPPPHESARDADRAALLIVTPHSSGWAPQEVLWEMLGEAALDLDARRRRLEHLFDQGDPYTEVMFTLPGARHLHAVASRFVVDLNRARDFPGSNGVIKLTDFDGRPLYPPGFELGAAAAEERLARYWDSFHREVERVLALPAPGAGGRVELLIAGHAMSATGPAIGPDVRRRRPALTLMTGGDAEGEACGHGPPSLAPEVARLLRGAAERCFGALLEPLDAAPDTDPPPRPEVVLNRPWSVDEIAHRYSRPQRPATIPGFGLEINRALYLRAGEPRERPDPGRVAALQRAFAAFAAEALAAVRCHPGGGLPRA